MVTARPLTPQQVEKIVEIAVSDGELWSLLKSREIELVKYYENNPNADPPNEMTQPTLSALVHELIEKIFGKGPWSSGGAIVAVRKRARIDLGLPI